MSDWNFLSGLAREIGYEVAVRDEKFEFCPPSPPLTPRQPAGPPANPLVLELGTDLLRVPVIRHLGRAGQGNPGPGWDTAQKKPSSGPRPRAHDERGTARRESRRPGAPFGDPTYVATDVPYRQQAEVDAAARPWPSRSPAPSPSSTRSPAATRRSARARPRPSTIGPPVRRQVHRDDIPASLRPDHRLHPASRSPGGRNGRFSAWPRAAEVRDGTPPGSLSPRSATSTTRLNRGRVKLTFPGCPTPTSATGPAPSSRAPARTAGRW